MACSDGNCILRIEPVTGQHTNGGCRCLRDIPLPLRLEIKRKLWTLKRDRDEAREVGRWLWKEAIDEHWMEVEGKGVTARHEWLIPF